MYWRFGMEKKMDDATHRRLKAGRLLHAGKGCTEVAKEVGVARQTAHTWKTLLDEKGIDALRAMGGRGRPAQLDEHQLEQLRACLLDSPTGYGFGTELWTLKRIRLLIAKMFDVSFSEVHVWRILGTMGFSNQKPERRAIECNEDAVQEFKKKTWPALKKKPRKKDA